MCGYIHEGEQPPEKCPVCGADKSMFILVEDNTAPDGKRDEVTIDYASKGLSPKIPAIIYDLVTSQHLHPISVHFPNGVLPVTAIFTIIAIVFSSDLFRHAAMANTTMVFLSMPLVIFSGYVDWKIKFGGQLSRVFMIKMICAGVVSAISLGLAIWWLADPDIIKSGAGKKILLLLLVLVDLGAAGVAGFLGGKLVFGNNTE